MDMDEQRSKLRHPWRNRREHNPSLSGFAGRLRQHIFCFRKAVNGSEMDDVGLLNWIQDVEREMTMLQQAWSGGDEFIKVLASHMTKQRHEMIPKPTQDDEAAMALITVMDDELKAYALRLSGFDWFWDFSDDYDVRSRCSASEDELKKIAEVKGGYFQKLWEHYVEKRRAAIKREPTKEEKNGYL